MKLSEIRCGRDPAPRRAMTYGIQGVGKSTFAAGSEQPIFIQTEDGLADIDCSKFPLAQSFEEEQKPEKYVQLKGTDCLNCKHSCQLEHQPVIGACGDKYPIVRGFCESCHCYFDIDTMRSDEDANWFCKKCWGEMV